MKTKNIGRLISILHRQSQIYFNAALKEFNITSAEYPVLLYLFHKDGITQDELSNYLYIDKAATARAIKSLEEKGYIIRNKDSIDKRCNRVYLSESAHKSKDMIRHKVWGWNEIIMEEYDDEKLDLVYQMLESMVNKVEQTDLKKILEE